MSTHEVLKLMYIDCNQREATWRNWRDLNVLMQQYRRITLGRYGTAARPRAWKMWNKLHTTCAHSQIRWIFLLSVMPYAQADTTNFNYASPVVCLFCLTWPSLIGRMTWILSRFLLIWYCCTPCNDRLKRISVLSLTPCLHHRILLILYRPFSGVQT